jgi:hypothetical protein
MLVPKLFRRLGDQTRSLENARLAATQLARQRVEREEVEIYLERLPDHRWRDVGGVRARLLGSRSAATRSS